MRITEAGISLARLKKTKYSDHQKKLNLQTTKPYKVILV